VIFRRRCDSQQSSSREFLAYEESQFPTSFNLRVLTFSLAFPLFSLSLSLSLSLSFSLSLSLSIFLPRPYSFLVRRALFPAEALPSVLLVFSIHELCSHPFPRYSRPISRALFANHPPSYSLRFRLPLSVAQRVFLFLPSLRSVLPCPSIPTPFTILSSWFCFCPRPSFFSPPISRLSPTRWNFLLHSDSPTFIFPYRAISFLRLCSLQGLCMPSRYCIRNVFHFYSPVPARVFSISGRLPGVSLSSINLFSSGASGPIFVVPFLPVFLASSLSRRLSCSRLFLYVLTY